VCHSSFTPIISFKELLLQTKCFNIVTTVLNRGWWHRNFLPKCHWHNLSWRRIWVGWRTGTVHQLCTVTTAYSVRESPAMCSLNWQPQKTERHYRFTQRSSYENKIFESQLSNMYWTKNLRSQDIQWNQVYGVSYGSTCSGWHVTQKSTVCSQFDSKNRHHTLKQQHKPTSRLLRWYQVRMWRYDMPVWAPDKSSAEGSVLVGDRYLSVVTDVPAEVTDLIMRTL
jgi:hypothetical protein